MSNINQFTNNDYGWSRGDYQQEKRDRRRYLNQTYPNKAIKQLKIDDLRHIGYAIGLGSTDTKKEYIDKILHLQVDDNPIIKRSDDGIYYLNIRCMLLGYILSRR